MNLIDIAEQAVSDFFAGETEDTDREMVSAIIGAIALPFRTMVLDELAQMTDEQIVAYVRAGK